MVIIYLNLKVLRKLNKSKLKETLKRLNNQTLHLHNNIYASAEDKLDYIKYYNETLAAIKLWNIDIDLPKFKDISFYEKFYITRGINIIKQTVFLYKNTLESDLYKNIPQILKAIRDYE